MLAQIGQIAINVHDVDRAVRFYRDTLGMRFLFQAGTLAFFDAGGVRLMLSPPEKKEFDHPASILYYRVADIEATHAALTARDVTFLDPPHLIHKAPDHDLWMAFFKDSEDNILALMSEKPRG
jgi:catechol 2,3-dioxygenase-like lactoylglutathione lyase family enzyme